MDDLKDPVTEPSLCRGEQPSPPITMHRSQSVKLLISTPAPHRGNCSVEMIKYPPTSNPEGSIIATKDDCAFNRDNGTFRNWEITLPSDISNGRWIMRWMLEATHVIPHEKYEQCVDIEISNTDDKPATVQTRSGSYGLFLEATVVVFSIFVHFIK